MVTAKHCEKCKEVEGRIIEAAKKAGVRLAISTFDSATDDAIALGIRYGLDDVPSFVINEQSFCGTDFNDADVEKAMRAAR